MYLKEFDLDIQYSPNPDAIARIIEEHHCEYHEATKLDYEANWKDNRRVFRLQTRCITSMFERLLGSRTVKTEQIWKVLVNCSQDVDPNTRVRNIGGVANVEVQFYWSTFSDLTDAEKKRTTLELLMKGIEKIALTEQWDLEPFRTVYNRIREADYRNEWIWRKPVWSPDRKHIAEVLCNHGVNAIDIFIVVRNKVGIVTLKQLIISECPDEWFYSRHLGKLQWSSNTEIVLLNKDGVPVNLVCIQN